MKNFLIVAKHEILVLSKSRWLYAFILTYAALGVFLFLLMSTVYKDNLSAEYDRLSASLTNMVIILSSLMALLLASISLTTDRSDKLIELLLSYPISQVSYMSGKYAGLFGASLAALASGTVIALISSAAITGSAFLPDFINLFASGGTLLMIYTGWGIIIGSLSETRLNAIVLSLIAWFFSIFLYELIIWITVPYIPFALRKNGLAVLIAINPAELVRIGLIFARGQGAIFGPDFYNWQEFFKTSAGIITALMILATHIFLPVFIYSKYKVMRRY